MSVKLRRLRGELKEITRCLATHRTCAVVSLSSKTAELR